MTMFFKQYEFKLEAAHLFDPTSLPDSDFCFLAFEANDAFFLSNFEFSAVNENRCIQ